MELPIWHGVGMPCGQGWTPARMDFGRRWPLHLASFLIVVWIIPRLEACVRHASARHRIIPVYEAVDPVAGVLLLN